MTLADVLVNGTVYRQAVSEASVMPVTGVSSRLSCATGKTVKVITDGSTPFADYKYGKNTTTGEDGVKLVINAKR